jgi:hypothetical protein
METIMALLTKDELKYPDYSWSVYENDDPRISGEPDSTELNRKEGYEVLYFINKVAEIHGLLSKSTGFKIERMLREKVPADIRSQSSIKRWIEKNWE